MTPQELRDRTEDFAVAVVIFCRDLRREPGARDIADQLSDSATSTSSNYRAACRARSHREFISKLAIAVEEADESVGWFRTIIKAGLASGDGVEALKREASEIVAILAASRRTAEANRGDKR